VASVGLIQTSVRPHDPITNVCFFRHALALDEARVKFLPLYVNGGATSSATPAVKEVWFPGNRGHMYVSQLSILAFALMVGLTS